MSRPRITIVTPNFNQAAFIEETILSVIGQNYPDLEYIIIDGGSTDGSVDIIKKYEKHLSYWVSEPDAGLYHALQKGFEKATGEIMGWINSDDKLHPDTCSILSEVFDSFKEVSWLTGCPSGFDEKGRMVALGVSRRWSKYDFYMRDYKWIQQESTFWRKSLWQKAGSSLNTNVKYAADFELWMRFFRYEKLFSINTLLGGFRFRSAQISVLHRDKYRDEVETMLYAEITSLPDETKRHLNRNQRRLNFINKLHRFKIFRIMTPYPYFRKKMSDTPGMIEFDPSSQKFHIIE